MPRSRSGSRSAKRYKLDGTLGSEDYPGEEEAAKCLDEQPDDPEDCCTICLQHISDRTVIPTCSHEFCFECLLLWTEQSRRCPLCSQNIGQYLIHSIRSRYDYRKRYLAPLRISPPPSQNNALMLDMRQRTQRRRQVRVWGTRERGAADESDKLERSISKRRWIYEHNLYAKHVASNAYTKYRPYPTPAQFAASPDFISRTTTFLRRELQVWQGLDVEFLTTLIISLMKSIDIRSESAVKLISEFLDMEESGGNRRNAEHFTHEVYSYVRSPYKDLFVYDTVLQYDSPSDVPPPPDLRRSHRWRQLPDQPSPSLDNNRSRSPSCRRRSRSSSRSSSTSQFREPSQDRVLPTISPSAVLGGKPETHLSINSNVQAHDRNKHEIRDGSCSGISSPPTSRRTPSPVAKSAKGKERLGPTTQLSSEIAENCSISNHADLDTRDNGGIITERALKIRPPRNQSLLETVKSLILKNNVESRGLKPAPTGSRHSAATRNTTDTAAPLARLSDPGTPLLLARLSDPQTPSIGLPSAGGEGDQLSKEKPNAALDTMEARARLLARLNREKRLVCETEHARSELETHGSTTPSPDLEAKEANLKVNARLYSRLAAEKRALSVSQKF